MHSPSLEANGLSHLWTGTRPIPSKKPATKSSRGNGSVRSPVTPMGTPRGINKVITSPASIVTVNNDGGTAIHNPYETSD